jgi:hypothetical protein
MGFIDGFFADNSGALGAANADANHYARQAADLNEKRVVAERSLNYHRLTARAWEEVALSLAARGPGAQPITEEQLRSLYLQKRQALFASGVIKGRDLMGRTRTDQPVQPIGPLTQDVVAAITKPQR